MVEKKPVILFSTFLFKILLIFALGAFLRLWDLSSDPSIFLDSGQVGDEGYWLYNARNLALFSSLAKDNFFHDLAAAPLFSFFSFLSFELFGVGFWQARLVSAISGVLTVLIAFRIGLQVNKKTAVLSASLLAINTLLLLHNRLAVGESLSLVFSTLSFFYIFKKGFEFQSGIFMALSLLSKTTSYLYIPSAVLMIISENGINKASIKRGIKFLVFFSLLFLSFFGLLYINFGSEISSIYSTFGKWYVPLSFKDLWQNFLRFFLHPFWGSPFLFSLLILSIFNILNYIIEPKKRTRERKLLILWLAGILVFGPFLAILSNARLLGLIIPITILASQFLLDRNLWYLNFKKITFRVKSHDLKTISVLFITSVPLSAVCAKIFLALLKRLFMNESVVSYFPFAVIVFSILLTLFLISNKLLVSSILRFNLMLLAFLPLLSFIPLFWSYLHFFDITAKPISSNVNLISGLCFFIFIAIIFNKKSFTQFVYILFFLNISFNIFGIASILYNPGYNILNSSKKLEEIVGDKSIIGFWGQALTLENSSKAIYWAPNLKYTTGFNNQYEDFRPEFLTVSEVFDSKPGSHEAWPDQNSLKQQTIYITSLNLSRSFLGAEREFMLKIYKIIY